MLDGPADRRQCGIAVICPPMPPVTGERVCGRIVHKTLRHCGIESMQLGKSLTDASVNRNSSFDCWFFPGASFGGFLRDLLWLKAWNGSANRKLWLHFHNASVKYWVRMGRFVLKSRRFQFVYITKRQYDLSTKAGISSAYLPNSLGFEVEGERVAIATKRIIWMSLVSRAKGFGTASRVAAILKESGWRFDVYGAIGNDVRIEDHPHATFHGFLNTADKSEVFAGGGILLLPSRYRNETLPLVLIEALAAGIPVVASSIGGIPEIVGSDEDAAGVVLSPHASAKCYAEALVQCLTGYYRFSANAFRQYREHFAHEKFQSRLLEIVR